MTPVDDIMSRIPLPDLAARLGVDEQTAAQATGQALPALLGGIQANAAHPGGAASLASAVQQHDNGLAEGSVNLDSVDDKEGDKIVGHVFGDQRQQVVQQLGTTGGSSTTQDLMHRLLPILAPIAMSYLARRLGAGGAGAYSGGIGGALGGILGGMGGQQQGGQQQGGQQQGGQQQGGQQQGGQQQGTQQQGGQQQGAPQGGGVLDGELGSLLGGLLGGGRRA